MIVEIDRLEENFEHGTFGKMRMQKQVFCDTIEPADHANKRNISSIRAGQYVCRRVKSVKYGETFEVCDVEDRGNILFHWGNFDDDTQGCCILGNGLGTIGGRRAVVNSKLTFKKFMKALAHVDEFHLTIRDRY